MQEKGRRKPLFFGLDDMTSQDRADSESAARLDGTLREASPRGPVLQFEVRFLRGARHVWSDLPSFRRPLQAIIPSRGFLGGRRMAFGRHWM